MVRSALGKLLAVPGPHICELPARRLSDIKRSRHPVKMDRDFDPEGKYKSVVKFAEATGFRACELRLIRPKDIMIFEDGSIVVHLIKGKNGQPRDVPVLKGYENAVLEIRKEALALGLSEDAAIFGKLKKIKFDEHSVRAQYAWRFYKQLEYLNRPRNELLHRRSGEILDKVAMRRVSEALGHHRLDVVLKHYQWNRLSAGGTLTP